MTDLLNDPLSFKYLWKIICPKCGEIVHSCDGKPKDPVEEMVQDLWTEFSARAQRCEKPQRYLDELRALVKLARENPE